MISKIAFFETSRVRHGLQTQAETVAPRTVPLGEKRSLPRSLLVARSADAAELNAQAKNAQNILQYWSSLDVRPEIYAFDEPDAGVAQNGRLRINRIRRGRLWWRYDFLKHYLKRIDGIFYPGMHFWLDYAALRTRVALGRRVPVIGTIEGLVGDQSSWKREQRYSELAGHKVYCQRLPPRLCRRVEATAELADHIIAISPFLARIAQARYGRKISVIPMGVDPGFFGERPHSDRPRPRVVCAGRVEQHKRPLVFLELARAFSNADFVWFGEGSLRLELIDSAKRDGLGNINFPGAIGVERLARELRASDIQLLPSLSEGVPKITQEAAAAGLAQIVFGFYETPSVVDRRNGFVVWTDGELKGRLDQLLSDRDLIARMGAAGQKMAENWNWRNVAPLWERQIIEVIRNAA